MHEAVTCQRENCFSLWCQSYTLRLGVPRWTEGYHHHYYITTIFLCFVFFCVYLFFLFFLLFFVLFCFVLFLFNVVLPFQRYSTLFVILECFRPQKIYLFFLCNISSLCAISYVPMVAIYVYQLNIWLLFESMWLNSMFISHEGVVCLYLHLKLHPSGK